MVDAGPVTPGQVFGVVWPSTSFDSMLKMFNLLSVMCSCEILMKT